MALVRLGKLERDLRRFACAGSGCGERGRSLQRPDNLGGVVRVAVPVLVAVLGHVPDPKLRHPVQLVALRSSELRGGGSWRAGFAFSTVRETSLRRCFGAGSALLGGRGPRHDWRRMVFGRSNRLHIVRRQHGASALDEHSRARSKDDGLRYRMGACRRVKQAGRCAAHHVTAMQLCAGPAQLEMHLRPHGRGTDSADLVRRNWSSGGSGFII